MAQRNDDDYDTDPGFSRKSPSSYDQDPGFARKVGSYDQDPGFTRATKKPKEMPPPLASPDVAQKKRTTADRQRALDARRKANRPTWGEADAINTGRTTTQETPPRAKAAVEPERKPVSVLGRAAKAVSGAADAVARMPKPSIISDDPARGGITGSLPPRLRRAPALRARATTEDQLATEKQRRSDAYDELGIVNAVRRRRPDESDEEWTNPRFGEPMPNAQPRTEAEALAELTPLRRRVK